MQRKVYEASLTVQRFCFYNNNSNNYTRLQISEKPSPPFPSLPDLLPLEEPVTGLTSLKVLHIFNSVEDVFNEIVVSDEENRKHLVPSGSIERRKGRPAVDEGEYRVYPHLQPSRAIAEVAESTLDFTAGLDQARVNFIRLRLVLNDHLLIFTVILNSKHFIARVRTESPISKLRRHNIFSEYAITA